MKRALGEQDSLFFLPCSSGSLPRAAPRLASPRANLPCTSPFYSGYASYFCAGLERLVKLWAYSRSVRNGLLFHVINRRAHPCPMTVNSQSATTSRIYATSSYKRRLFVLTVPHTHKKRYHAGYYIGKEIMHTHVLRNKFLVHERV